MEQDNSHGDTGGSTPSPNTPSCLVGSLVAPWVDWDVEKRRRRQEARIALIAQWRNEIRQLRLEDGDGHANAVFREDQTCWGPATYVDLSLEPTQDEAGAYLPRFGAQAYRWWPGAAPCVYFHIDGIKVPANRGGDCPLDDSVHLTADEAIRLATALLKAAGDIKGEPNGPASRLI